MGNFISNLFKLALFFGLLWILYNKVTSSGESDKSPHARYQPNEQEEIFEQSASAKTADDCERILNAAIKASCMDKKKDQ